jgi:hypothetical protein
MNPKFAYTAAALAAALSLAAMPADAQDRRGENRDRAKARSAQAASGERESSRARAVPRPTEGRQTAAAQQAPQDNEGRRYQGSQARSKENVAPSYSPPTNSAPQYRSGGAQARPDLESQRSYTRSEAQAYSGSQRGQTYYGDTGQRAVPRPNGGYASQAYRDEDRRGYAQPGGGYRRYESHGYVRPPHYQPYRPFYFSRPYYGFRPHVHLGFGVWLGVSVPYPWAYFGSYMPRVYGYYDEGYYGVAPGVRNYGGLSFDIQPSDADLFVDGEYVGAVGTFTPYGEPLTLWPGVHRIAIVRDGFRTMEWEVTVQPGEVIPYRGMLARW